MRHFSSPCLLRFAVAQDVAQLELPLRTFLDSSPVNDRTDDDKSLVLATRLGGGAMSTLYADNAGRTVELGPLIAKGGEGAVYQLVGNPQLVAKIYHQPPAAAKVEKLTAMVRLADPNSTSMPPGRWRPCMFRPRRPCVEFCCLGSTARRNLQAL